MAQWTNLTWKNIFINLPQLLVLCEISGPAHQALVILVVDRQTKYR